MSDDVDDNIEDIFNQFKKFFNIDSGIFDMDFYMFPELLKNQNFDPNDEKIKGYKISYHHETGMDKPDIKIEGNVDMDKLKDYIKRIKLPEHIHKYLDPKALPHSKNANIIDVEELSLEPCDPEDDSCVVEPFSEVNDFDDFTEIIFEVPGIELSDVQLTFTHNGTLLTISAQKSKRKYLKEIQLQFRSSIDHCRLEVNNGIATLKVFKRTE